MKIYYRESDDKLIIDGENKKLYHLHDSPVFNIDTKSLEKLKTTVVFF